MPGRRQLTKISQGDRVRKLRRIIANSYGNVAIPGAAFAVAIIAVASAGLDFMSVSNQRAELQTLADNASLAAVRELAVTSQDEFRIKAVAAAYVQNSDMPIDLVQTRVNFETREVQVNLTAKPKSNFSIFRSAMKETKATATARLSGRGGNVCMIGLSPISMSTLRLRSRARITAQGCAVYSNSTSKASMSIASTAEVIADLICVAGGFQGGATKGNKELAKDIGQSLLTDCTPIDDPLSLRAKPAVGACDFSNSVVTGVETLEPGVYCGGLVVDGGEATLNSGDYVITGGPLRVTNNGTITGDYVGFYLSGEAAKVEFDYDSNISLSAPKSGALAGLLLFSSPFDASTVKNAKNSGKKKPTHYIRSDNARRLVGTIYLPSGKLLIDGRDPIADRSEYTVVIADTFELQDGPNLVLRTDYHLSDIPVPEGVGPVSDPKPRLVE